MISLTCRHFACVAVATASIAGCSSAPTLTPGFSVTDHLLSSPSDPGSAVGKCFSIQGNGLAGYAPCPSVIGSLVKQTSSTDPKASGSQQYETKILVFASSADKLTESVQSGAAVAHETAIYQQHRVTEWKASLDDDEYEQLAAFCSLPSRPSDVIAITEMSGCSVYDANANVNANAAIIWEVKALQRSHSKLGEGTGFWIEKPTDPRPASTPVCTKKVAVKIQALSLREVCTQHFVQIQVKRLRTQLAEAIKQKDRIERERTGLASDLAEYGKKLAEHNDLLRVIQLQTAEIQSLRAAGQALEAKLREVESRSRVTTAIPAITEASKTAEGIMKTVRTEAQ